MGFDRHTTIHRHEMSHKYCDNKLLSDENIIKAYNDSCKSAKMKRSKTKSIRHFDSINDMVVYYKEKILDFIPYQLHTMKIREVSGKDRFIVNPDFDLQVITHACSNIIKEYVMNTRYSKSYGSLDGVGPKAAKDDIEEYIKNNLDNSKKRPTYHVKLDAKKFFNSIDKELLREFIARQFPGYEFNILMNKILNCYDYGIPLGLYSSQWFANFFLVHLDRFITFRKGKNIYYARYMDDLVFIGPNKRKIQRLVDEVISFAKTHMHITIKGDYSIERFCDYRNGGKPKYHPLDFVGYVFYHDHTTIRKRLYVQLMSLVVQMNRRMDKYGDISLPQAYKFISYYGWLKSSDSYNLIKNIKDKYGITVEMCKHKVSYHSKKQNQYKNNISQNKNNEDMGNNDEEESIINNINDFIMVHELFK